MWHTFHFPVSDVVENNQKIILGVKIVQNLVSCVSDG